MLYIIPTMYMIHHIAMLIKNKYMNILTKSHVEEVYDGKDINPSLENKYLELI